MKPLTDCNKLLKIFRNKIKREFFKAIIILLFFSGLFFTASLQATTAEDLQRQIQSNQEEIKKLETEIAKYQTALNDTRKQSNTLKNEIGKIDLTRKELGTNISLTQVKLSGTENNIQKLTGDITVKKQEISEGEQTIGEILRHIRQTDNSELTEILLAETDLASFWNQVVQLENLNIKIKNQVETLTVNKRELETKKLSEEQLKAKLSDLKNQLAAQKKIADDIRAQKDALLAQTKSKETNYQKLLADRQARKKAVEAEMSQAEEKLKFALDPSSIPKTGSGVLSYPLSKINITQYFGNTDFAKSHAAVYNGKGHNGIDLAASVGTPILAAADGTVTGIGDTDKTCPNASYGKWVLIKHNNGLATLYAHLSLIGVSEGQSVKRGQTISYSGNTGYSTGPHLHFTVYAAEAVQVGSLKSKVAGCGTYRLPISAYTGYLNPMNYLSK